MASALPPYRWRYHATEPIERTVAPAGRALFFQEEPAPSVAEVEAERYITQFVSNCINGHHRSRDRCRRALDQVGRARGSWSDREGPPGGRTEAVLLAALRAAAPAVRAVRSADRANMVM